MVSDPNAAVTDQLLGVRGRPVRRGVGVSGAAVVLDPLPR